MRNTDKLSAAQAHPLQAYFSCVLRSPQLQKSAALVNARDEAAVTRVFPFQSGPTKWHTHKVWSSSMRVQDSLHFNFVLFILYFSWVTSAQKLLPSTLYAGNLFNIILVAQSSVPAWFAGWFLF